MTGRRIEYLDSSIFAFGGGKSSAGKSPSISDPNMNEQKSNPFFPKLMLTHPNPEPIIKSVHESLAQLRKHHAISSALPKIITSLVKSFNMTPTEDTQYLINYTSPLGKYALPIDQYALPALETTMLTMIKYVREINKYTYLMRSSTTARSKFSAGSDILYGQVHESFLAMNSDRNSAKAVDTFFALQQHLYGRIPVLQEAINISCKNMIYLIYCQLEPMLKFQTIDEEIVLRDLRSIYEKLLVWCCSFLPILWCRPEHTNIIQDMMAHCQKHLDWRNEFYYHINVKEHLISKNSVLLNNATQFQYAILDPSKLEENQMDEKAALDSWVSFAGKLVMVERLRLSICKANSEADFKVSNLFNEISPLTSLNTKTTSKTVFNLEPSTRKKLLQFQLGKHLIDLCAEINSDNDHMIKLRLFDKHPEAPKKHPQGKIIVEFIYKTQLVTRAEIKANYNEFILANTDLNKLMIKTYNIMQGAISEFLKDNVQQWDNLRFFKGSKAFVMTDQAQSKDIFDNAIKSFKESHGSS